MYPIPPKLKARLANDFIYHAPIGDQTARYQEIRDTALELATLICQSCPDSRERSHAMTMIDTVVFFANASIARHEREETSRAPFTAGGIIHPVHRFAMAAESVAGTAPTFVDETDDMPIASGEGLSRVAGFAVAVPSNGRRPHVVEFSPFVDEGVTIDTSRAIIFRYESGKPIILGHVRDLDQASATLIIAKPCKVEELNATIYAIGQLIERAKRNQ